MNWRRGCLITRGQTTPNEAAYLLTAPDGTVYQYDAARQLDAIQHTDWGARLLE
jgi:hypothetical protein